MLTTVLATSLLAPMSMPTPVQGSASETFAPRLLRTPDIHGDTVVFNYAGDLWITSLNSTEPARRLTSHAGNESNPHFSNDGQWVAFTGSYDGTPNVYVVPTAGGVPKRLTYSPEGDRVTGWTPDGKVMYATSSGNPVPRQQSLYLIDPKGGVPISTPIKEFSVGSYFASGDKIAYTRVNSFNFNWRRYRGGTQGRVGIFDFKTLEYKELPSKREQSFFPMVIGNDIFYISDRANGTLNLYKNSGGRDTQLTKFADADIKWPNTDGKTIIFEKDGILYTYDVAKGAVAEVKPRIVSEQINSRPTLKNLVPYMASGSLSPSGARVVLEARGELFSVPAKSGETRNLTGTSGAREQSPQWSPDGKSIAYISDADGEFEVYVQPQQGGEATQLTKRTGVIIENIAWLPDSKTLLVIGAGNKIYSLDVATKALKLQDENRAGYGGFDISPDGKWAVLSKASLTGSALYLHEFATGKQTKITEGFYGDVEPVFDTNGKWIYFVSNRTFEPTYGVFEFSLKVDATARIYALPLTKDAGNPYLDGNDEEGEAPAKPAAGGEKKEMTVDFDGIFDRAMVLPLPAGSYRGLTGVNGGFLFYGPTGLSKFDLGGKEATPLYQGYFGGYSTNPAKTKLLLMGRGNVQVVDLRPGINPQAGRVDLSNVEAIIDPEQEWKQIYWEAWRYERDYFYDSGMMGVDWKAIGEQYAKYLPFVKHRNDLNYILGNLIGELGTGHAYITGPGDMGAAAMAPRVPVGALGADFVADQGGLKFSKVLRGSNYNEQYAAPLGAYGVDVKEGEFLVAIDSKPVNAKVNPSELLIGKVGKTVSLSINSKPGMEGARKVRVKPIGSDSALRYWDFIEGNRKKVAELSGGKIGYMHISNTAAEGSSDFVRGFYNQWDRDALIVDERWNGGGYIQPWFVSTLARSLQCMIQPRHGIDSPDAPVHDGPKAMLINEYAGSGGDFFPYMFKSNGVGPLIGRRTWGGLVGIDGGRRLIDGGGLTAPAFSLFNPKTNEIIAENTGVDPDMDIDMRPDLVAKGRDPQLEAAVEYLLKELAKRPAKKPRTETPKVSKPGRIGG